MTTLKPRSSNTEIPAYSLTGDLLAFHRCGLQYRYQNRGRLPPSTPVQLWFGGFIHGVMEESYLLWRDSDNDRYRQFPWPYSQSLEVQIRVDETRLRPISLIAPSNQFSKELKTPKVANIRAFEAVNGWGPKLFPLISKPEVLLHGVRPMPELKPSARSNLYEITGVVDILASASLDDMRDDNILVKGILESLDAKHALDQFEVVIDYKGSDRPSERSPRGRDYLRSWRWQLQTYAWLRSRQRESLPVKAGVLLFLNEMHPSREVYAELAESVAMGVGLDGATSEDIHRLRNYRETRPRPQLSLGFRLRRSLQVHTFSPKVISDGASLFDDTVVRIEEAVLHESTGTPLTKAWVDSWQRLPTPDGSPRVVPDIKTCIACDHRTYCDLAIKTHGAARVGRIPKPGEE